MTTSRTPSLYRVQIDLVGFAGNTFLDGWGMTTANLKKVNAALNSSASFIGVSSVRGSISSEDDNSPGENKVYVAVEALVSATSERQAIAQVLANVPDPVVVNLPARGGFEMDGDADCLDSDPATAKDVEAIVLALPARAHKAIRAMHLVA